MYVESQFSIFLSTVATGITLGVLFDCYRVLRGTFRPKVLITWVTDLLYWLIATAIVFIALVLSNWGELRFYVFLGIISGVGLYYRLLSLYMIRLFAGMIKLTKTIITLIKNMIIVFIIRPVSLCVKIVIWPFRWISSKIKAWYQVLRPEPPLDEKK
ncbi:spore cortex biosynthesis protein YabQ [Pelosinus propionicus]|uniref:Spore cortex biosynthesis protein YabQ n=1 Tax=Pelosinus propionicus DSM 13327 TaxID=1123291 RepID=A0A1I4NSQ4_9FIRM|nr:spore cortex biosynthesis protein YabQ [Pelosinus propionicus]SFM18153.1 spore cortex biosynthesis protein YabQ [Pelosinus propionicus DSM 13327]